MNFDFSDDQKMLADQVAKFLAAECPMTEVRKTLDGNSTYSEKAWQGLADMGLMGTALPEQFGGVGATYLELCLIAKELGASLAPTPFSSTVYLFAEAVLLAGTESQKELLLAKVSAGELIGTLAVTEDLSDKTGNMDVSFSDGKLSGNKLIVVDGGLADMAVVAASSASGSTSLYLVDLNDASVTRESITSLDPTRNTTKLAFSNSPAELLGTDGEGEKILREVYDRAAILFAFEQLGGAQRALDMAVDYANERYAFGRPIGSFQGLKHMMSDMYVALKLAESNCYYAAWALFSDAPELPLAAATARVSTTQAYQLCSKDNIQVHGGMGFTWEFDCHLHYRRSNFLTLQLGGLSSWEDRLVDCIEAETSSAA